MTEPIIPPEVVERFVERRRRERIASGKTPWITSPEVYLMLDGLLARQAPHHQLRKLKRGPPRGRT